MFNFNNTEIPTAIDDRISELLEELDALSGDSESYNKVVTNIAKLMELKNNALKTQNEKAKVENEKAKIEIDSAINQDKLLHEEQKLNLDAAKITLDRDKLNLDIDKFASDQEMRRSWKPSPDAVVGAAASVVGILLVLHYEKLGVVTSKALGFVGRMTK
jgi:hypothetical protein